MRVLILHGECLGCAGAQRVLGFFLEGLDPSRHDVTVAHAPNTKLERLFPATTRKILIPGNQKFSLPGFLRQFLAVRRLVVRQGFDVLHGWTARDWELTAAVGKTSWRPAIGSLHEHPHAGHIGRSRRRLMKASARLGLDEVLCVSQAVASGCGTVGYVPERLSVVHNGIPSRQPAPPPPSPSEAVNFGYLGLLDESKGLSVLMELCDALHQGAPGRWQLKLAGGTLDTAGDRYVAKLRETFGSRPWWPNLEWLGWVNPVAGFLESIDLLIMPSTSFDAFPTVLLEAAEASRPVFAHRIGGVAEIVIDGRTGWLFDRDRLTEAKQSLVELALHPLELTKAGAQAAVHVRETFTVAKMVEGYFRRYYLHSPAHPA
ncbi:MAG: glycosyltransferase family 4 protein [Verrucomicrobiales bacterium]|nr:glycosyltransferase family 4 protein [Verrucomicrobiales bacterium]